MNTPQIDIPVMYLELPDRAQAIYKLAQKSAMSKYDDTALANRIAEAAVQSEYLQIAGKWQLKSITNYHELDGLYITKANYKDGVMLWSATASDTGRDVFEERMSIELYQSFLKNLDGHEYVSLAHYPSLEGRAEFGKATEFFLDGNRFKARGTFVDDPKGIALYNAIRKDRRDNIPQDERIRISIGFWDYRHRHGDLGEWNYKSAKPCAMCAAHIKDKVYLEGKLDHLACTRIPARTTTSIEAQ